MKYIIGLLLFFCIGISTGMHAREIGKDTLPKKQLREAPYSLGQFKNETFLFIERPVRWHKADWLRVGVVLAGTAAIMPFDQSITNMALGHQRFFYSVPVVGGRVYGEWYTIGIMTFAFAGYGILAHDNTAKKIGIEIFQAGVYSGLITEILKTGIGRARPYNNLGPFDYHPFSMFNYAFNSSPSGHATSAFALSTVLFRNANTTLLKILAFVPAGFTVFSRVYQLQHWASDEFLGAAIGFSTGMWVVNLHDGKRHKTNIPADNK